MAARATDEDAATLALGPDFQDARCLLNSEVAIILKHKLDENTRSTRPPSQTCLKMYDYVERVRQFKDKEIITQIRNELSDKVPHEFEAAQLGNLCPEDADEAKALIPSLGLADRGEVGELDDAQLTDLLQQLVARRQLT